MRFVWDPAKRDSNIAKHGIDFTQADLLFDGRKVYTFASRRDGEERCVTVGEVGGRFLAAVWTRRDDATRLISIRRARRGEIRAYGRHDG